MSLDLQYPIGTFKPPTDPAASRSLTIRRLRRVPAELRLAVVDLSEEQLGTPYRPAGWTVHQLVHHVADSHLNFYLRLKLAMTEENPVIRPYDEQAWSDLSDVGTTPISVSLAMLDATHERADRLLTAMSEAQFQRTYVHPASGQHTIDYLLGLYAWHGAHHTAHVMGLRDRMGWRA